MSNNYYRRNVCRMCGGRDIKVVVKLTPTPVGGSFVAPDKIHEIDETYPLDLYQCSFCGYACLMDVVAPELLFTPSIQVTSMSLGVVENLGQLARTIIDRVKPSQGSLVVDIGSNDGTLLKFFKEAGMHVLGVEPASFASDKANGSGIETICDFFNRDVARKIKHQKGPAKIITAIRVFANIDDLDEFVEGVRELLAPDGVFAFETAYIVDVLDKTMVETIYHEHLSYDSVNALDIFFKRHRMQLVDIEHIPLKGGSLRGVVQTADGPMSVAPSVDAMKANEARLGHQSAGPVQGV